MIFPFLYRMTEFFGVADTPAKIALYATILATSFNCAQFVSAFPWGRISDARSRRFVLLVGMGANIVTIILFGLSRAFWWAVVSRTLNGLANGNVGVCKSYLREMCNKNTATRAYALIGLMWGVGMVVGPAAGGLLANFDETVPAFGGKGSPISYFPYLLPCLCAAALNMLALVVGSKYLLDGPALRARQAAFAAAQPGVTTPDPLVVDVDLDAMDLDSHVTAPALLGLSVLHPYSYTGTHSSGLEGREESDGDDDGDSAMSSRSMSDADDYSYDEEEEEEEEDGSGPSIPLLTVNDSVVGGVGKEDWDVEYGQSGEQTGEGDDGELMGAPLSGMAVARVLSKNRNYVLVVLVYGLLSLADMIYDETFALWSVTRPETSYGAGYGFSQIDIAIVFVIAGSTIVVAQLVFMPRAVNAFGVNAVMRFCMIGSVPILLTYPFLGPIRFTSKPLFWILLSLVALIRATLISSAFTAIVMMTNHSVMPEHLGVANGIAQSMCSLARTIGPIAGGAALTFSLSAQRPYPFNHHLVFVLAAFLQFLAVLLLFFITSSINYPLGEQPDEGMLRKRSKLRNIIPTFCRSASSRYFRLTTNE